MNICLDKAMTKVHEYKYETEHACKFYFLSTNMNTKMNLNMNINMVLVIYKYNNEYK